MPTKPKKNYGGDINKSHPKDQCQTPPIAVAPLLKHAPILRFGLIWEPAAGERLLVEALYKYGCADVIDTDILYYPAYNFFTYEPALTGYDFIVTNPPFSTKFKWLARCYELGKPFALLMPVDCLGATTAQTLFRKHGIQVIFLNGRVNYKMPNMGWGGRGAQFPSAWFTWKLGVPPEHVFDTTPMNPLRRKAK